MAKEKETANKTAMSNCAKVVRVLALGRRDVALCHGGCAAGGRGSWCVVCSCGGRGEWSCARAAGVRIVARARLKFDDGTKRARRLGTATLKGQV